tara:strand:+ start:497 stop:859 length:363 start_codon:yes stop_codon:yes gene_type:complete
MKLERKHLASYFPYELSYQDSKGNVKIMKSLDLVINMVDFGHGDAKEFKEIKPILRPLSDLTNEFKDDFRFTERAIAIHKYGLNNWVGGLRFDIVEFLFKNHYDVFGLIEKGLAIDKNTI